MLCINMFGTKKCVKYYYVIAVKSVCVRICTFTDEIPSLLIFLFLLHRPVSAYALFFRDTQAAIKGGNPSASFGEVSKIVASMWDSLDPDTKNVSDLCQIYKKSIGKGILKPCQKILSLKHHKEEYTCMT